MSMKNSSEIIGNQTRASTNCASAYPSNFSSSEFEGERGEKEQKNDNKKT
jgi:hypothetical protein